MPVAHRVARALQLLRKERRDYEIEYLDGQSVKCRAQPLPSAIDARITTPGASSKGQACRLVLFLLTCGCLLSERGGCICHEQDLLLPGGFGMGPL